MKFCKKCCSYLSLSCFGSDSKSKDRLAYWCRSCKNAYRKQPEQQLKDRLSLRKRRENPDYAKRERLSIDKYQSSPEGKLKRNERLKIRRRLDPIFRLKVALRDRVRKALKLSRINRMFSITKDVNGSLEEVMSYLTSKLEEGMTWDNYGFGQGKWTIDHIIPLSHFNLEERKEYLIASNYRNLQPMWFVDNSKKNDILPDNWKNLYDEISKTMSGEEK